MIFAILPVKDPRSAKQRLASLLSDAEREWLARAMYEEMLAKLCATRGFDGVLVITNDETAARRARESGADVVEEREQISHSHSADTAARKARELGADAVALLPIDVPLVTVQELDELAVAAQHGVLIVPSADGTGTNALVRTPPDAIPSRFGPGSLQAHLEEARSRGVAARVVRPPGLLFDVDTPEDVEELLVRAPESRIAGLLHSKWARSK
jgi:2-phospho-L-lactate/phosphoenolpyruvate guanylyltransferase